MAFIAKWRQECSQCEEMVEPGDGAMYDLEGDVCHEVCPPIPQSRAKAVCPHCWMELPPTGKCDCRD